MGGGDSTHSAILSGSVVKCWCVLLWEGREYRGSWQLSLFNFKNVENCVWFCSPQFDGPSQMTTRCFSGRIQLCHCCCCHSLFVSMLFYVLTTSKILSELRPICDSGHLRWLYSAALLGDTWPEHHDPISDTFTLSWYSTEHYPINVERQAR